MIEHVGWLKAFSGFWKAIVDRLALWIGRRKPKLYAHFQPGTSVWCIANSGSVEYMQIVCRVSLTHDDLKQGIIIVDVYPFGTTSQVSATLEINIPPQEMVKEQLVAIVSPILGKKGEPWTGKLVLVDQFLRKHKTEKVTFKWVGPDARTQK